ACRFFDNLNLLDSAQDFREALDIGDRGPDRRLGSADDYLSFNDHGAPRVESRETEIAASVCASDLFRGVLQSKLGRLANVYRCLEQLGIVGGASRLEDQLFAAEFADDREAGVLGFLVGLQLELADYQETIRQFRLLGDAGQVKAVAKKIGLLHFLDEVV